MVGEPVRVLRALGLCALSFMALFAACTCPGPNCALPSTAVDAGVLRENTAARVSFVQPVVYGCEEEVEVTSVSVKVVDEQNEPVPASATFERTRDDGAINVHVELTTGAPGWYHLTSLIEPSLASVQTDLLVARDRSNVQPTVIPRQCIKAERTSAGTVLCDDVAFRGSGAAPVTGTFAPQLTAVRGDVVWTWTRSTGLIERWKDSAAALVREPGSGLMQTQAPEVLLSSEDGNEAFYATTSQVVRVAFRSGALVELARHPLGTVLTPAFAYAGPQTLFLFEPPVIPTVTSKVRACGYSLAADQVTKLAECQQLTGIPMGVVDGAVWFRDQGALRAYTADADTLRLHRTLALPAVRQNAVGSPGAPIIQISATEEVLAARLHEGRTFFDLHTPGAPTVLAGASASAVFLVDSDRTRVFAR